MWLSVQVPEHGLVCIDLSNSDPSVHDVEVCLGRILHLDFSEFDFMLGSYRLTESMLLADFGLTEGTGELTLRHRASTHGEASQVRMGISESDPIEDCSPNISETDPIEFTPPKHECKTRKRKKQRVSRTGRRSTSDTCDASERFAFPKWKSSV